MLGLNRVANGYFRVGKHYYKEMCSEDTRTLVSPETVILLYWTS